MSTMISHWTSIASVLRHWRYDPATDLRLRALLRNFQLTQSVQRKLMPKSDLHLILAALLKPQFTIGSVNRPSDDVTDLKWQKLKITFLLSLATARWRSYLHALCVSTCLFTHGDVLDQLVVNLQIGADRGHSRHRLLVLCGSVSEVLPTWYVFHFGRNAHSRSCCAHTACSLNTAAMMAHTSVCWTVRLLLSAAGLGSSKVLVLGTWCKISSTWYLTLWNSKVFGTCTWRQSTWYLSKYFKNFFVK